MLTSAPMLCILCLIHDFAAHFSLQAQCFVANLDPNLLLLSWNEVVVTALHVSSVCL